MADNPKDQPPPSQSLQGVSQPPKKGPVRSSASKPPKSFQGREFIPPYQPKSQLERLNPYPIAPIPKTFSPRLEEEMNRPKINPFLAVARAQEKEKQPQEIKSPPKVPPKVEQNTIKSGQDFLALHMPPKRQVPPQFLQPKSDTLKLTDPNQNNTLPRSADLGANPNQIKGDTIPKNTGVGANVFENPNAKNIIKVNAFESGSDPNATSNPFKTGKSPSPVVTRVINPQPVNHQTVTVKPTPPPAKSQQPPPQVQSKPMHPLSVRLHAKINKPQQEVKVQNVVKIENGTKVENNVKVEKKQPAVGEVIAFTDYKFGQKVMQRGAKIFGVNLNKPVTTPTTPEVPKSPYAIFPSEKEKATTTPSTTAATVSSLSPKSPNYISLYKQSQKLGSSFNSPSPPAAAQSDYYQAMPVEANKIYLDSTHLKNLVRDDPNTFRRILENNQPILMKMLLNLQHYSPSPRRKQQYLIKHFPTQTLGFPKKAYSNLFVTKTNETAWFCELMKQIVTDVADMLDTDEFIAHYFISKALEKTKFYQQFLVSPMEGGPPTLSQFVIFSVLTQDGNNINYNKEIVRKLMTEAEKIYYQDRLELLEAIVYVMNDRNKQYRSIRTTAIGLNIQQFLWNTLKALGTKTIEPLHRKKVGIPDPHERKEYLEEHIAMQEQRIIRLLVSLTNRYLQSSRLPKMLNLIEVFEFFDGQQFIGLAGKYNIFESVQSVQQNQYNLVFNLLPFRQLMDNYKNLAEIRKNKKFTKQMYMSLFNGKSEITVALKHLLPSFKDVYDIKQVPDYDLDTLDVVQKYAKNNYRWLLWLEIFLGSSENVNKEEIRKEMNKIDKYDDNSEFHKKFKLFCLILNQSLPQLWSKDTYPNIKKQIVFIMKSNATFEDKHPSYLEKLDEKKVMFKQSKEEVFELMTQLLGTKGEDSVQPIIAFMAKHLGKDFMYEYICRPIAYSIRSRYRMFFNQSTTLSETKFQLGLRNFVAITKFLTKCIMIHTRQLKWIEQCLFYASSEQKPKKSKSNGIRLVLFLFDCFLFFKDNRSYVICKHIIDALTNIVIDQTNVRLVSVASSIIYYQHGGQGQLYNFIEYLDKNHYTAASEQKELKVSLLKHLKAILDLPFVENMFCIPRGKETQASEIFKEMINRPEVVRRYERLNEKTDYLHQVCQLSGAQSLWVHDLLPLIINSTHSVSLEIVSMILEKLSHPATDYSKNEYQYFSHFIEILNKSNIHQKVLSNLRVVAAHKSFYNRDIDPDQFYCVEKFQNILLCQYKGKNIITEREKIHEIHEKIYFSLKIIEKSLDLLQLISLKDSKQTLIVNILQQIVLVKHVNEWFGKKFKIYHYDQDVQTKNYQNSEKKNIVIVIASYFKMKYQREKQDSDALTMVDLKNDDDVEMMYNYWKYSDIRLFFNREKIPQRVSNSKKETITIRVVRILTKCLLFWSKVNLSNRPSLFALLMQANIETGKEVTYRDQIYFFFKKLILKTTDFQLNKDTSQLCEIFNFFITLLNIEPNALGIIFDEVGDHHGKSLNKLLQLGITNLLIRAKYQKQHIYLAHKIILFIRDLFKTERYKEYALKLTNLGQFVPALILNIIPSNQEKQLGELIRSQVDSNEVSNVLKEQQLYLYCIRYSLIQNSISLTLYNIVNNYPVYNDSYNLIFQFLYLSNLPKQILNTQQTSFKILDVLKKNIQKLKLPYHEEKWSSIKFVDGNAYGFGRNYDLVPIKKKMQDLPVSQMEKAYSWFHKYNLMRSLEVIRGEALKRWSQLFIILLSTGKYGYSLSNTNLKSGEKNNTSASISFQTLSKVRAKNNTSKTDTNPYQLNLKQMRESFGPSFTLLNTKIFKIQKGFEDILSSKIDIISKILNIIIEQQTIVRQYEKFESVLQIKFSVVEMILKWICKLNPHADYVESAMQKILKILQKMFASEQKCKTSLIYAGVLNTLGMLYRIKKMDPFEITKLAIDVYLDPDCTTRNIVISSFIPYLSSHSSQPEYQQLCAKVVSLLLIQNPDPIDYMIGAKSICQFYKTDSSLLLKYKYFQSLPTNINLNNSRQYYNQLWRFQIIARLVSGHLNLFQNQEIVTYLNKISVMFCGILANAKEANYIYLPKFQEEKFGKKMVNVEYLIVYLAELKILSGMLGNKVIMRTERNSVREFLNAFFENQFILEMRKYKEVEGEPLLKNVPVRKEKIGENTIITSTPETKPIDIIKDTAATSLSYRNLTTALDYPAYRTNKSTLEFMAQIISTDCIRYYIDILKSAITLGLWKQQHNIQQALYFLETQMTYRLEYILRNKQHVMKLLQCYYAYLNSAETSMKWFYTNTLMSRLSWGEYVGLHRSILESLYETGVTMMEKKENCYDVYLPEYDKKLERLKEWVIKGDNKMRELYRRCKAENKNN